MKALFYIYAASMFIMSCIAFFSYRRDKMLAQKGAYRTAEKTLLILAVCLGGVGAFAGMKIYRHKTKHLRFQIIVPVSMALQVILLGVLIYLAFLR